MKKIFLFIIILNCVMISKTFATNGINVMINGKTVQYNDNSGYPYVDENNRTMVPLRATMEMTGAAVGYDSTNPTAIVITEHNRIEVPIGTNYIYRDNNKILNDTISIIKNGRTYLPIRIVLESAGYTVEWDGKTRTVNAYNYDYNSNELAGYSTDDLSILVHDIINGNVIYINGKYYCTPDYWKMANNVQVNYLGDDLNKSIYPISSWQEMTPEMSLQLGETIEKQENEERLLYVESSNDTAKILKDYINVDIGKLKIDKSELKYTDISGYTIVTSNNYHTPAELNIKISNKTNKTIKDLTLIIDAKLKNGEIIDSAVIIIDNLNVGEKVEKTAFDSIMTDQVLDMENARFEVVEATIN